MQERCSSGQTLYKTFFASHRAACNPLRHLQLARDYYPTRSGFRELNLAMLPYLVKREGRIRRRPWTAAYISARRVSVEA